MRKLKNLTIGITHHLAGEEQIRKRTKTMNLIRKKERKKMGRKTRSKLRR